MLITKKEFNFLDIKLRKGDIVFLNGDLGSGKTTLSKYILNNLLQIDSDVISPTYTYYNRYKGLLNGEKIDVYHFDLYRLEEYEEFFAIGGEEILDNNSGIIFIEWPFLIEKYYNPDIKIDIKKTKQEDYREIDIIRNLKK